MGTFARPYLGSCRVREVLDSHLIRYLKTKLNGARTKTNQEVIQEILVERSKPMEVTNVEQSSVGMSIFGRIQASHAMYHVKNLAGSLEILTSNAPPGHRAPGGAL